MTDAAFQAAGDMDGLLTYFEWEANLDLFCNEDGVVCDKYAEVFAGNFMRG